MRRLAIGLVFVFGLVLLPGVQPAATRSALRVRVSPHLANAPATLHLDLWIDPNAADRKMTVTADSGDFERSSSWTLDGANSQRMFTVDWPNLPAGFYTVRVELDLTNHRKIEALDWAQFVQR